MEGAASQAQSNAPLFFNFIVWQVGVGEVKMGVRAEAVENFFRLILFQDLCSIRLSHLSLIGGTFSVGTILSAAAGVCSGNGAVTIAPAPTWNPTKSPSAGLTLKCVHYDLYLDAHEPRRFPRQAHRSNLH